MKLLDALAEITESDFDSIVAEITEKEKDLAKLKRLLSIVCVQLGKEDPSAKKTWSRKPKNQRGASGADQPRNDSVSNAEREEFVEAPEPPAGTTKTEHYRSLVQRYIQANGPTPIHVLVKRTGIPEGSMGGVIKHPMFVKTAIGYGLSSQHR